MAAYKTYKQIDIRVVDAADGVSGAEEKMLLASCLRILTNSQTYSGSSGYKVLGEVGEGEEEGVVGDSEVDEEIQSQ